MSDRSLETEVSQEIVQWVGKQVSKYMRANKKGRVESLADLTNEAKMGSVNLPSDQRSLYVGRLLKHLVEQCEELMPDKPDDQRKQVVKSALQRLNQNARNNSGFWNDVINDLDMMDILAQSSREDRMVPKRKLGYVANLCLALVGRGPRWVYDPPRSEEEEEEE